MPKDSSFVSQNPKTGKSIFSLIKFPNPFFTFSRRKTSVSSGNTADCEGSISSISSDSLPPFPESSPARILSSLSTMHFTFKRTLKKVTPLQYNFCAEELSFSALIEGCELFEDKDGKQFCNLLYVRSYLGNINYAMLFFLNHIPASNKQDDQVYEYNQEIIWDLRYIFEELVNISQHKYLQNDHFQKIEKAILTFDYKVEGIKSRLLNELFIQFLSAYSMLLDMPPKKRSEIVKLIKEPEEFMVFFPFHPPSTNQHGSHIAFSEKQKKSSIPVVINYALDTFADVRNNVALKSELAAILVKFRSESLICLKEWIAEKKRFKNALKIESSLFEYLVKKYLADFVLLAAQHQYVQQSEKSFLSKLKRSFAFKSPKVVEYFTTAKPTIENKKNILDEIEDKEFDLHVELTLVEDKENDSSLRSVETASENIQRVEKVTLLGNKNNSRRQTRDKEECFVGVKRVAR